MGAWLERMVRPVVSKRTDLAQPADLEKQHHDNRCEPQAISNSDALKELELKCVMQSPSRHRAQTELDGPEVVEFVRFVGEGPPMLVRKSRPNRETPFRIVSEDIYTYGSGGNRPNETSSAAAEGGETKQ